MSALQLFAGVDVAKAQLDIALGRPTISVNQVNIAGHFTRDPKVRYLSSGTGNPTVRTNA
jgi:hypothetical protein